MTLRPSRDIAYRSEYALEWLSRASDLRIHHARPIVANRRVSGVLLLSRSPRVLFVGNYEDRGKIALGVVLIFVTLVAVIGLLSPASFARAKRWHVVSRPLDLARANMAEPVEDSATDLGIAMPSRSGRV